MRELHGLHFLFCFLLCDVVLTRTLNPTLFVVVAGATDLHISLLPVSSILKNLHMFLFVLLIVQFESYVCIQFSTRRPRCVLRRGELCPVGAAICKNKGVGSPGVGGAHMQRVRGGGADVPRGVQVVQLHELADDLGAVGVVAAEALVHVAVEDDGLGRG